MNRFMKAAVEEAFKGIEKNHGGPFGAVIVQNGVIISRAHNMVISSNDPTAHAEILSIRRAAKKLGSFELSGCKIYSSCEPCPMCLGAILWARIKTLYYGCSRNDAADIGFDDKLIYEMVDIKDNSRLLSKIEMDREECLKPLKAWAKKSDRIIY
jgi:guanine deaminase